MATPTLGGVPTTINAADVSTGWTLFVTAEPDIKKQGTNSMSGIMRNDLTVGYYTGSANMTGQHVRFWINFASVGALDVEANNGMEFYMYDGTNTAYWVAFGSDTYAGGWKNYVLNCNSTPKSGTVNLASVTRWGLRFNLLGTAPANKINTFVDFLRYGDGYYATAGTSGDEITIAGIYTLDVASGYGIVDRSEGIYFCYGALTLGNGATTTWFKMDGEVFVFTNSSVATGLYKLVGAGSGARVNILNSVIRSAGTTDLTRFIIDMDDTNLVSCSITDSFITRAGECRFKSGETITGNTFSNCGQILAAGANLSASIVNGYAGTADTASLVWDVNTDPNGYLNNMVFTKGTVATHAIQFGTTSPTTMTLSGVTFTGYNASNGQTDSAILVSRTTGTVTINITGGSSPSYKSAGATVVIVSSVSVTITVVDIDNNYIENAQTAVYLSSNDSEIFNQDTNISGVASGSFSGTVPAGIYVRVRKSSTGTRYIPVSTTGTITSTGFSATITLRQDTNA